MINYLIHFKDLFAILKTDINIILHIVFFVDNTFNFTMEDIIRGVYERKTFVENFLYPTEKSPELGFFEKLVNKIFPYFLGTNLGDILSIDIFKNLFICKLSHQTLIRPDTVEPIYVKYQDHMHKLSKNTNISYEADMYLGIGAKRYFAFDMAFRTVRSSTDTPNQPLYDYLLQIDSTTLLCNQAGVCKTEGSDNSCLYSFFNSTSETLAISDNIKSAMKAEFGYSQNQQTEQSKIIFISSDKPNIVKQRSLIVHLNLANYLQFLIYSLNVLNVTNTPNNYALIGSLRRTSGPAVGSGGVGNQLSKKCGSEPSVSKFYLIDMNLMRSIRNNRLLAHSANLYDPLHMRFFEDYGATYCLYSNRPSLFTFKDCFSNMYKINFRPNSSCRIKNIIDTSILSYISMFDLAKYHLSDISKPNIISYTPIRFLSERLVDCNELYVIINSDNGIVSKPTMMFGIDSKKYNNRNFIEHFTSAEQVITGYYGYFNCSTEIPGLVLNPEIPALNTVLPECTKRLEETKSVTVYNTIYSKCLIDVYACDNGITFDDYFGKYHCNYINLILGIQIYTILIYKLLFPTMLFDVDAVIAGIKVIFLSGELSSCVSIYDLLIWFQMLDIIRTTDIRVLPLYTNMSYRDLSKDKIVEFDYLEILGLYHNCIYSATTSKPSILLSNMIENIKLLRTTFPSQIITFINHGSSSLEIPNGFRLIKLFDTSITLRPDKSPFLNILNIRNSLFNILVG
jgi:hypothetical protein